MGEKNRTGGRPVKDFFVNLGLVILGILLFSLAFPNILVPEGIPLLAWIAYIPVFLLIRRVNLPSSIFWGALYGYGAYNLFNYWLSVFHPVAGLVVSSFYLVFLAVLFPLLKLAEILFPRRGYAAQWLLWLGFEYLRTLGFLGYSYGITGYSQWKLTPLIQIAGIGGVWLVSALVVFPSAFLAWALPAQRQPDGPLAAVKGFFRRERPALIVWACALVLVLVYGFTSPLDYSSAPRVTISLIQQNNDPWIDEGPLAYANNLQVLKRLSEEALADAPGSELVVWSETAFVPRIYWHLTYRDEPAFYPIVKDLLDFLAEQDVPFVLGNDDARKEVDESGGWSTVDYNGVLLFEKNNFLPGNDLLNMGGPVVLTTLYRKLHLVPFTEHFPYKKQFPTIYRLLNSREDVHLWRAGTEPVVFDLKLQRQNERLKFSTPICFEDTFGYLSRKFVKNGAEVLVNLSNDAWSKSVPAQMQHLSMAVFRAVENRRPMVRSTASGQTCAIDPNGKVLAMAEPFKETWLNAEIPLAGGNTFYTFWGDIFGQFFVFSALAVLIAGSILGILRIIKKRRNKK